LLKGDATNTVSKGTSGDTGSAAIEAVAGMPEVKGAAEGFLFVIMQTPGEMVMRGSVRSLVGTRLAIYCVS